MIFPCNNPDEPFFSLLHLFSNSFCGKASGRSGCHEQQRACKKWFSIFHLIFSRSDQDRFYTSRNTLNIGLFSRLVRYLLVNQILSNAFWWWKTRTISFDNLFYKPNNAIYKTWLFSFRYGPLGELLMLTWTGFFFNTVSLLLVSGSSGLAKNTRTTYRNSWRNYRGKLNPWLLSILM